MNPIRCPKCGKINDGTTYFCIYCGTIFEEHNPDDDSIPPIFLSVEESKNSKDNETPNNTDYNSFNSNIPKKSNHRLAILLGYFFSIMGGLIGLIIAIYLITRDDPNAKKHGKIQIGILLFWIIVMGLMIWTGAIDYHMLFTPMNFTSMDNLTKMNDTMNMTMLNNLTNMSFL